MCACVRACVRAQGEYVWGASFCHNAGNSGGLTALCWALLGWLELSVINSGHLWLYRYVVRYRFHNEVLCYEYGAWCLFACVNKKEKGAVCV